MDGDEVWEEWEHDGDDGVESVARLDRCTVTRTTGRLEAVGTPYRNCMHLIDCLTSPFPSSL